jgi:hypothetical protein
MNLRWWDGLDWTEARRAPPSAAELRAYESQVALEQTITQRPSAASMSPIGSAASSRGVDSAQVIEEVRSAARSEIDRAADVFTQRARAMQREITPLVTDYTNRLLRWIRWAAIIAVVLLVAYFVFQVIAQASLFDWIGDRIDNIFDEDTNGAPALR